MAEMTPARKRVALAFVAVGIALIVQRTIASGDDADVVGAPERPARAQSGDAPAAAPVRAPRASAVDATLRVDRLGRRAPLAASAADAPALFAVQSWQPPPPPPPPPAPPPEPVAPSFPYPYLGGLTDDAGRTAFFNRGERVLSVRAGDTVDGAFHVDHLDETSMTVTYVPLNQTAQVALGGGR